MRTMLLMCSSIAYKFSMIMLSRIQMLLKQLQGSEIFTVRTL